MKKIPTLFIKNFDKNGKFIGISQEITPGMEWVLAGEGDATIKYDGSATMIKDGVFYKRYDCKRGKTPPEDFIPCCDPDPNTGHWPGWVKVKENDPGDKWYIAAYNNSEDHSDWTYEAIGKHFQSNPYNLDKDVLIKHGQDIVTVERSYEGLKKYLEENNIEGLVFWKDGEPKCKIRKKDFEIKWRGVKGSR